MKSDTLAIIVVAMAGFLLTATMLELKDAHQLAEAYKESAYRSLAMAEDCATQAESLYDQVDRRSL